MPTLGAWGDTVAIGGSAAPGTAPVPNLVAYLHSAPVHIEDKDALSNAGPHHTVNLGG